MRIPPDKTIVLVDGTALCYRAFYALKLSNSKGFPTGAVYGFYTILEKVMARFQPAYMSICFDVSRKTFRSDKFKEYKIHRPPSPDELICQIPHIKKLVRAWGLPLLEQEGFEADDVIAALASQAARQGHHVVIVGSDKDMLQLLSERVTVFNPHTEECIDEAVFEKQYGFKPEHMVDYLALTGDSVDNVPGAKGIGKVTAGKLIKEYGSIEALYEHLDALPARVRAALAASKDMVALSKELVVLARQAVDFGLEEMAVKKPDIQALITLFGELEFKSLLKKVLSLPQDAVVETAVTSGIPARLDCAQGIACMAGADTVFFCCKGVVYSADAQQARVLLDDTGIRKITYDVKAQLLGGLCCAGSVFDIAIAAYLLEPDAGEYSLRTLAAGYLQQNIGQGPAASVRCFEQLWQELHARLAHEGLEPLFENVEMPLAAVLADMERAGVVIDCRRLEQLQGQLEHDARAAQGKIYALAGKEFNLNSPKQLQQVLFTDLHIPPVKKTKTGFSTDEEVLHVLARSHEIAALLLEYRQIAKIKTTYVAPVYTAAQGSRGRLHAQFNQMATGTGRLSSSSPNLQSIPVKGTYAAALRRVFVPSHEQGCIISADYSQIELRLLAHCANDARLKEAFQSGVDIHIFTAALIFDTTPEKITDAQREVAKRINFSIVYGMGAFSLAQELSVPVAQAQEFIDSYFTRYPGVRGYIDRTLQEAHAHGYVRTLLGRKRILRDINSSNTALREFSRRQAVNAPIQGSCADMIKIAMVRIAAEIRSRGFASRMIMQIHDELVFDAIRDEQDVMIKIIKNGMENALLLDVPIKVDIACGSTWGDMEHLG